MRVCYYERAPGRGRYSLEGYLDGVRHALSERVETRVVRMPAADAGIASVLRNLRASAGSGSADVHHITGDIHYVTAVLPRDRTVLTVHDCGFENLPRSARRTALRLLWYRLPVKRATVVTTVSEFTRQRVLHHTGCNPAKVVVIPTCVSRLYRRVDKPFESTCPMILHIGTAAHKNLERLSDALRGITCTLHVVGRVSDSQAARLRANDIRWSSSEEVQTADLVSLYAAADLVAFVSTYEGFGMPIVEANLVGRPVVTSLVASMPEVAGGTACLVDPYDTRSIRTGIERVIHDASYRRSLVARGYANAARFDPRRVVADYENLYDQVAKGATPAPRRGPRLRNTLRIRTGQSR